MKDCHPLNDEDKKCPHCAKSFTSIRGKNQHVDIGCPEEKKKLWVPCADINTEKKNHRHVNARNTLSEHSKTLTQMFKSYLESGSSSPFLLSRGKRNLSGASIDTYTGHLRDFLDFVDVRISFQYYFLVNNSH